MNSINTDAVLCADGLIRPIWASACPLMQEYYDSEWGMPITDEQEMYEKLCLELFQSGLSWATILRKREGFRTAFANFNPDIVATYSADAVQELMQNSSIIRNYKKIKATIANAKAVIALRNQGGIVDFIWSFKPSNTPKPINLADIPKQSSESLALAQGLKKHGFLFIGPVMMYSLMEAIGMVDTHLMSSHRRGSSGVW